MRSLGITASLSLLATGAMGQTTHTVGAGGFAQINNAIAAASPGDIVLVSPGTWSAFTTNIGVTVRGTGPGVIVTGATANLPAGQTLHLVDIDFAPPFTVTITGGRADIDRCTLTCTATSSDVRFQSCTLTGFTFFSANGKHGLDATNANITAIDSSFAGATGVPRSATPSTYGIRLQGCTFLGSHLVVHGGDGYGGGSSNPKPALLATNSTVWISDSTLSGGVFPIGGTPPCPVDFQGSTTGRLPRCTLIPTCASSIPTNGPVLGMHRPSPLQSPGTFSLEFTTNPNGLIGVFFATGMGNVAIPGLEQPVLLDLATTFHLELLTANASGVASGTWNVPAGLTNQTFFFQAVGTAPAPALLQLSPTAGGVVN